MVSSQQMRETENKQNVSDKTLIYLFSLSISNSHYLAHIKILPTHKNASSSNSWKQRDMVSRNLREIVSH